MADEKPPAAPRMPPFDEMPAQVGEAMSQMAKRQGHVFDAMLKQNIEMLDFLRARFERDRAMVAELSSAEDPATASRLWADFWQKAAHDYSEETGKMTGMLAELTSDAVRSLKEGGLEAGGGRPQARQAKEIAG